MNAEKQFRQLKPRYSQPSQISVPTAFVDKRLGAIKQLKMIHAIQSACVQRAVLTRNLQYIVDTTILSSPEEIETFRQVFQSKYSSEIVEEMIERICGKDDDAVEGEGDEEDEFCANITYHGDLNEYDDGNFIDSLVGDNVSQLARKPNVQSGPKTYTTRKYGQFTNIQYTTGSKGDIDFKYPTMGNYNPVLSGSEVDLKAFGNQIDKKNRQQHFAIADKLYAIKNGKGKASTTTNMRKGNYTWHHMETPCKMVLVDMEAHAKHGHNGGVYLW